MDSIRQALGEDKISYFGFSYGSELGATWATMFPDTVRATVLDGAVNPNDGYLQEGLDQAKGFERRSTSSSPNARRTRSCAFHNGGNSAAAYDRAGAADQRQADRGQRRPHPGHHGRASTRRRPEAHVPGAALARAGKALAAAQKGDGKGLLDLYDEYYVRNPDGTYDNSLEAFTAISCLDDPGPKSVAGVDAVAPQFLKVAPRFGPSFAYSYQSARCGRCPRPRR